MIKNFLNILRNLLVGGLVIFIGVLPLIVLSKVPSDIAKEVCSEYILPLILGVALLCLACFLGWFIMAPFDAHKESIEKILNGEEE